MMVPSADADGVGFGTSGISEGSVDGAVEGRTPSLGTGVRSGAIDPVDVVGATLGTDPRPPLEPVQAAATATTATSARAEREEVGFMFELLVRKVSAPSIRPAHRDPVAGR